MTTENTPEILPIAEALFKLEFWHTELQTIRAERREIITDTELSDPRRAYKLNLNYDMTYAIRERFKECQQEYAWAIRESINRIAESVPVTVDHNTPTLSANDGAFDVYEGRGSEL